LSIPGGGREEPGGGGTFDGFAGKALGDEAAEAVEVNEVGKFEAVTEGSAGGENRIPQRNAPTLTLRSTAPAEATSRKIT